MTGIIFFRLYNPKKYFPPQKFLSKNFSKKLLFFFFCFFVSLFFFHSLSYPWHFENLFSNWQKSLGHCKTINLLLSGCYCCFQQRGAQRWPCGGCYLIGRGKKMTFRLVENPLFFSPKILDFIKNLFLFK